MDSVPTNRVTMPGVPYPCPAETSPASPNSKGAYRLRSAPEKRRGPAHAAPTAVGGGGGSSTVASLVASPNSAGSGAPPTSNTSFGGTAMTPPCRPFSGAPPRVSPAGVAMAVAAAAAAGGGGVGGGCGGTAHPHPSHHSHYHDCPPPAIGRTTLPHPSAAHPSNTCNGHGLMRKDSLDDFTPLTPQKEGTTFDPRARLGEAVLTRQGSCYDIHGGRRPGVGYGEGASVAADGWPIPMGACNSNNTNKVILASSMLGDKAPFSPCPEQHASYAQWCARYTDGSVFEGATPVPTPPPAPPSVLPNGGAKGAKAAELSVETAAGGHVMVKEVSTDTFMSPGPANPPPPM